jgi:hypothetical protein
MYRASRFLAIVSALALAACASEEEWYGGDWDPEPDGKADSVAGIVDPGDQVWMVEHAWDDLAPGGEQIYEELYASWVQNGIRGEDVVEYELADGFVVPAPSLECADTALSLRFFFAQEHKLPMFVAFWDNGQVEALGHFGWVRRNGTRRKSYGGSLDAPRGSDFHLAASNYYLPDDEQSWPSPGSTIGGYMDAAFRNKRFGYFMQDVWIMVYSANVAESINSYYIRPDAIRAGDLQLHRSHPWRDIGHTITIQTVKRTPTGKLEYVGVMQSYMPTTPWLGNGYSELVTYEPEAENNSGLRRWRKPVKRSGVWYLMSDPSVSWNTPEDNPEIFDELFSISIEDELDALLSTIDQRRAALINNPNSCNRRVEREEAFELLYDLYQDTPDLYRELGFEAEPSREALIPEVDKIHRVVEDFIWARMFYQDSRVCHWNPSNQQINADMYEATVRYNMAQLEQHGCEGLRIFRAENAAYCAGRDDGYAYNPASCAGASDGFDDLRDYAAQLGLGWANYSNDERGDVADITTDALDDPRTPDRFCELFDSIGFASNY